MTNGFPIRHIRQVHLEIDKFKDIKSPGLDKINTKIMKIITKNVFDINL